jgi:hypothetical protein
LTDLLQHSTMANFSKTSQSKYHESSFSNYIK